MSRLVDRFSSKYVPIPESGCWIWIGSCSQNGYGRFSLYRGKTVGAHRLSWEMNFGKIPEGLCVLHKCDVPPCVNPNHLFLGTHTDNHYDAVTKGRKRLHPVPRHPSHCSMGHEFTDSNTVIYNGSRKCKECNKVRAREWWRRKNKS